jgi:hypothetical protein
MKIENGAVVQTLQQKMKRAMDYRDMQAVRETIAEGYDPNSVLYSDTKETALHHAARYFDVEMCRLFLGAGAKPGKKDKYGATPLQTAVEEGRPAEIVEVLLKAGADANWVDKDGTPMLHIAAARDNSSEKKMFDARVCQLLIDHGADLFAQTAVKHICLHDVRTVEAWRFFVNAGIAPDYIPQGADAGYLTPFQFAVNCGEFEIVGYCVAQGTVDLAQRTIKGRSLTDITLDSRVLSALRSGELVEEISEALDTGTAGVAVEPRGGFSPL